MAKKVTGKAKPKAAPAQRISSSERLQKYEQLVKDGKEPGEAIEKLAEAENKPQSYIMQQVANAQFRKESGVNLKRASRGSRFPYTPEEVVAKLNAAMEDDGSLDFKAFSKGLFSEMTEDSAAQKLRNFMSQHNIKRGDYKIFK